MKASAKFLCAFLFLGTVAAAQTPGSAPADPTQFSIEAKRYSEFSYKILPGITNVRITGSFKATGGPSNGIIVLVMNDAQWALFSKGVLCPGGGPCTPENGRALYNSGEVTQGTVNLVVPNGPATYHVIFNNSVFTYGKTIQNNLTWQWVAPK